MVQYVYLRLKDAYKTLDYEDKSFWAQPYSLTCYFRRGRG